jgi:outer membrane autotransporter protein
MALPGILQAYAGFPQLPLGPRIRFWLASSTALSAGALMLGVSSAAAVDVSTQPQLNAAISAGANPINVVAGNLALTGSQAFAPTTDLTVATGASLALTNATQVVGSLGGGGVVTLGTQALVAGGDNNSTAFSGAINMTGQTYVSPSGSFYKIGSGTLTIDNAQIQLGSTYIVQGEMAQTSGNTAIAYLAVGENLTGIPPSPSTLLVSGGTITFGTELQVGDFGGTGTVIQTGGTVQVIAQCGDHSHCAAVNIGNQSGNGAYNISGGELDLTGGLNTIGRNTGTHAGSTGALNISGGVVDLSANSGGGGLIIGYGNPNAGPLQSQGTITQTGGILRIHNDSTLYLSGYGTGVYNLNGGTLEIGGNSLQAGYGGGTPHYQFNLGGGTIQVIEAALTTNVNATLTAGSISTIDTNGLGATFSGVLSGGGALAKAGAGTLVLSGLNTYAGGTTIGAGVLQATNNSSVGTGAVTLEGSVFQAGANGLAFANNFVFAGGTSNTIDTQAFSLTLSGAISGAGGLTKLGAGILTLSGANAYAGATLVNAGTLRAGAIGAFAPASAFTIASGSTLDLNSFNQTIGSLVGAGAVTLGAATLTTGGDGTSTTFSGGITGAGGLIKTGAGALTLSCVSTYGGGTTISGGILDVNGSLVSSVTVNAGGTLMGDGAVGGMTINSGGIVAPGNSIGTLNVNGNASFNAGSAYQVEVNAAGQADKIAATGTATLSGGMVQVLAQAGVYATQTKYTILTAAGGVNGAFSNVTSNFAFLTPTLSYDPNDVFLTLSRNATYFSAVAQTPNQRAVGRALDLSTFGSALVQAVLPLTAPQAAQAFDALSGEIHASVETVLFDDSRYMRQAVLGRLRQASFGDEIGPMAALSSTGPALAYAEPQSAPGSRAITSVLAAPARAPDTVWWGQGVGAWGRIAADGDAAAVSRDLAGFFTGVDSRFGDNWRAGIASGYTNSSLSSSAQASSADIDAVHFAAYALANCLSWNLRTGADFAWNMIGSSRSVLFPGFTDYTTARYDAGTAQLFGELGYGVALGGVAAEPFAGIAFVHSNTNGFSETGGVAALAGSGNAGNVGYSTLGVRIAANYPLPNGMVLTPRVSLAWQHAFGDVTPVASLAFQNTGSDSASQAPRSRRTPRWLKPVSILASRRRRRSASPIPANSPVRRRINRSREI